MARARRLFALAPLPDGRAVAVGGRAPGGGNYRSAELFDPARGGWQPAGCMQTRRSQHQALTLPSGDVLAIGGYNTDTRPRTVDRLPAALIP
jgi:hypothetical protein